MPDVMDCHVSLRWHAKAGSTYDGEIALWGFRLRPGALGQTWPSSGVLTPTNVDLVSEVEATTNFDIVWEHVAAASDDYSFNQGNLKQVANVVWARADQMSTSIPSSYELQEIRFMCRGINGRSPGGSNKFYLKSPIAGKATGSFSPNHAVVLTHNAFNPGRKGKGRTYVGPVASAVLTTSGLISAASQTALRDPWAAMMSDIVGLNRLTPANVSFPSFNFWDIQGINCGDEMDVQNRRRAQRPEIYSFTAVTP